MGEKEGKDRTGKGGEGQDRKRPRFSLRPSPCQLRTSHLAGQHQLARQKNHTHQGALTLFQIPKRGKQGGVGGGVEGLPWGQK